MLTLYPRLEEGGSISSVGMQLYLSLPEKCSEIRRFEIRFDVEFRNVEFLASMITS